MNKIIYALFFGLVFLYSTNTFSQISINGKVIDSENNQGLSGANIIIKNSTIGTASDNNGEFILKNLKDGNYTLRISYFGYETVEKDISLNGSPVEINFNLKQTSIDLNAVVVTGTKSEKQISESPVFTQLISKNQIEQQGITYIPEILSSSDASFEMVKDNTVNSFKFDGLGAQYTLFLIDGERIAGETKGAVDLSRINPANIERIEIIKGAASTLYGSNAIGGVVNIITRSVSKPMEVNAGVKSNIYTDPSVDETRADNYFYSSLNISEGKISSFSDFKLNHYSPYDLNEGAGVHGLKTQENENNFSLNQKFNYKFSDKFSVTARVGYYQLARDFSLEGYPDKHSKDLSYGLKAQYYSDKNSKLELSWHSDRNKIYDIISDIESLDYDNFYQDIRFLGNYNLSDANKLTAGLEYINEEQSSVQNNISDKKLNNFVIFLQDEIKLVDDLSLIIGGRTDIHSSFGTHFTPQASAMYSPGNFNFRANFGKGFRAPTVKELYTNHYEIPAYGSPVAFFLEGNEDLKPEASTYYSLSAQYTNNKFDFSVNFAENRVNNLINTDSIINMVMSQTPYGPMPTQIDYIYSNVNEAKIRNINLMAKIKFNNYLSLNGSYTYTDPKDVNADIKLVNVRNHNARLNLDYMKRFKNYHLTANFNASYFSKKDVTDIYSSVRPQPRVELNDYTLFRLTTTHTFNNKFIVTLGVNNIFNKTDNQPQYFNFASPGRTYVVGLSVSL